jgi:hypothetical protein
MEKKENIFWGVILIVLGILLLGNTLDWFNFDWHWREIARFWPILIILAGVFAFLNRSKSVYNATSALLIAFAIPLGIYHCTRETVDKISDKIEDGVNIDIDDLDNNDDKNTVDTTKGDRTKNYYAVSLDNSIKEVNLELNGGAAEFDLEESSSKLFEANTYLSYKNNYTLSEDLKNGIKEISFKMKDKKDKDEVHIDWDGDGDKLDNDVVFKLNTNPIWNIDMGIGAGKVNFDLSKYKVKKLKLETGAASIDLKLGDKMDKMDVSVESGVAAVKLHIPESVACEIRMEGAFNAKDFEGFTKVGSGRWQTPNFDKATKKINLDVDSGLSSLKIDRY